MNEQVSAHRRTITALDERTKGHAVDLNVIHDKFKELGDWQKGMNRLLLFDRRIDTLENQAKSDLIAVTKKLEEVQRQAVGHIRKVDAYKMTYGLQVDMMKAVMDPVRHRSGKQATPLHPKRDPEV